MNEEKLLELISYKDEKGIPTGVNTAEAIKALRFIALRTISDTDNQEKYLRKLLVAVAKVEAEYIRY